MKLTEKLTGRKATAEEIAEARREYDEFVREISGETGEQLEAAVTTDERPDTTILLAAVEFASRKHSTQRRKDKEASPYINHPITVAHLLAHEGGVTDLIALLGAVLHDTIEDTETTGEELEQKFGLAVRRLVEEVTDDKALEKSVRKDLQVKHAPHLSLRAKTIKLGDKIANVQDVTDAPPKDWDLARRAEYLNWTERVVEGCRGANDRLEKLFAQKLARGRSRLLGH